jgi:glycosyltransferase involved in cell wall biosynthesis
MRILVNAAAAKMGGAVRHLQGFVKILGEAGGEHEFWLCVDEDMDLPQPASNVHLNKVSRRSSVLGRYYWHQIELPRLSEQYSIDMILSILNFGPSRPPVRQVVFQRNPIYFCDHYLRRVGWREQVEARMRRWLTHSTMRASEIIGVPSVAMQEMILSVYPEIPKEKFRVIPHGFDADKFLQDRQPLPEQSRRLIDQVPQGVVRLLYATHPAPHKGIEILLPALRAVRDAGMKARLFLTMEPADWPRGVAAYLKLAKELDIEKDVVLLGRIPQKAIAHVYEACDLFVFPSLCESFGFPMLEAMSAGLPIIAAETAINREILGDAAVFYPPLDFNAAAALILRVMKEQTLADRLSRSSLRRITEMDWSWKRYAREFLPLIGLQRWDGSEREPPSMNRVDDVRSIAEFGSSATVRRDVRVPVSVVVLTLNEEVNVGNCLESVAGWADEIFIVDSGSSDRTQQIAKQFTDKIVVHPFSGYAAQRNWALDHLPFAHEWVLFLDADERLSPELRAEIPVAIAAAGLEMEGFYLKRRLIFMGRWIRHGGYYPTWILRLFRHKAVRCEDRSVNEHFFVRGRTSKLNGDIIHEDRRALDHWISKHNCYAKLEANELLKREASGHEQREDKSDEMRASFSGSQAERKRWLRDRFWNRLPPLVRPFLYFTYRFFFRMGFLDGRLGFIYHFFQGLWFPFLIDVMYLEKKHRSKKIGR